MNKSNLSSKLFQFNQEFDATPKRYGAIELYQVGEVNYEQGFDDTHAQWCFEISIILSGSGVFSVDDSSYPVKERDIFISPASGKHTVSAPFQKLRYFYLGFNFAPDADGSMEIIKAFFKNPLLSPKAVDNCGIGDLFNCLLLEFCSELPLSSLVIKNYLELIITLTYRTFTGNSITLKSIQKESCKKGRALYATMKYVENNLLEIKDIRQIAHNLNHSYSYLSHTFKKKTGITLQRYIICKKIEKGCKMLEENRLSITDIAIMLNYESLQTFGKAFKSVMGTSPMAYKQKFLGE